MDLDIIMALQLVMLLHRKKENRLEMKGKAVNQDTTQDRMQRHKEQEFQGY